MLSEKIPIPIGYHSIWLKWSSSNLESLVQVFFIVGPAIRVMPVERRKQWIGLLVPSKPKLFRIRRIWSPFVRYFFYSREELRQVFGVEDWNSGHKRQPLHCGQRIRQFKVSTKRIRHPHLLRCSAFRFEQRRRAYQNQKHLDASCSPKNISQVAYDGFLPRRWYR